MIEGDPKGNGFTGNSVLAIPHIFFDDTFYIVNQLIIQQFISIEVQYPVGIGLL